MAYRSGIEGHITTKLDGDADPATALPAGQWSLNLTSNNIDMTNFEGNTWYEGVNGVKKGTGSVNVKPKKGFVFADAGLTLGATIVITLKEDSTTIHTGNGTIDSLNITNDINGAPVIAINFTTTGVWTSPLVAVP